MYRKSNLKVVLVLLIVLTVGFSIGYAYLNSTLTINGTSTVQKNTWDTNFDNIKIREGSVTANIEPTVEGGTKISRFDLILQKPGDFYEFTVDVVNGGTLDAMVSNIVKTPDLSSNQQKYLDYKIEYENCVEITKKQLVKVEEFVRVKVRVEYKKDLNVVDLPTELDLVSLGFEINYEQADDTGVSVLNNGVANVPVASGDINEIGTIVTIGDQLFYTIGTDGDNVKLLAMYNLYVGGEYDINTGTWTAYGSEATGLQKRTMIGYSSKSKKRGTTVFSDTYYWPDTGNYPVYVYDSNSTIYSYVENYKNYLESLGTIIIEARLISAEELEHFGCTYDTQSCTNAPSFIYSTSYWTGSAYSNSTQSVYAMTSNGYFNTTGYNQKSQFGVRPVIVISKDYFN